MNELDIITKVIHTLSSNAKCKERYASELENFRNRKIQAESNKYRLGVIGVTSSGKSTMINSLLGETLLPVGARPSSSQLVSCFHSKSRSATVYFLDNNTKVYSGNSLNQKLLEKYGDEGVNTKNREKVKQIELTTPKFPFDDNIILIDSPGLDAYGYEGHEQLTMNSLLPTIDFCIFVTTCKTNSDDKMLSILNTIAEYEKPVIIVQNMIDSIKPSLDGKKSVADVAQDLRVRVERIINRSNIKDKSKVHIVQISAINALKARQNGLKTNEDREILEASNYKKLVAVVNTAFNQVRPVVEGHRLLFLKKEILRIANAAKEDGAGVGEQFLVARFQYEDTKKEYEKNKKNCNEAIEKEKESLQEKLNSKLNSIRYRNNFNEGDIEIIKEYFSKCDFFICKQMQSLNQSIISVCEELNVDSRNIITDFPFHKPDLRLKKKTEVIEDGYWKGGETRFTLNPFKMNAGWFRHQTKKEWIDTSYTIKVTDVTESINNAINYINSSINDYNHIIQRWQKSIEITENKLYDEIENRRREHDARIKKVLDCQAYLQIGTELTNIADNIKTINEDRTVLNATSTDVKQPQKYTLQVNHEILPMYRLSEFIRIRIQYDTFRFLIGQDNRHHVIIGWDEYCEAKFIRYAFNQKINVNKVAQGNNILGNSILLIHNLKLSSQSIALSNKIVYILVNATQIGAALSEISRIQLQNVLRANDELFFVIQDFNEIINGNSVSETLDNVIGIKQQLKIGTNKVRYMLLHDNPIYNLACAEAQTVGCSTQSDEIKILNNLQKRFYYLLPKNKSIRNDVESTICKIIQKLGKL